MGKKKDKDIIISFLGESRSDVTGSSVLINYKKTDGTRSNILIEMGLVQGGNTIEKDLALNRKMLERYNKELMFSIETVFLLHCHIDHIGSIPYLNKGFDGNIISTKESMVIGKHLIEDSVNIHQKNIQKIKETKGKKIIPFYTNQDMYDIFEKMEYRKIGEKYKLNDQVEYRFINSGHVLGGAMLELWIRKPNNSIKHIIYTSDMGSNYNNDYQYFVPKRDTVPKCNLLISEATYNTPDRSWNRRDAIEERKQLKSNIKNDLCSGKEVLLSSFSFGRLQNILCTLYDFYHEEEWFRDIPIIVDGVLLHKINDDYLRLLEGEEYEYFNQVLHWKNIKVNKAYDGTLAILSKREPRIIVSTSGFLTQGRIVTYLQQLLPSDKVSIYLTGYCGEFGDRLLNPNQKTITIDKKVVLKRAKVTKLKCMSSHIQYTELINMFKEINCDKILIHHSSNKDKDNFIEDIKNELDKANKHTKVECVTDKNNQFIL